MLAVRLLEKQGTRWWRPTTAGRRWPPWSGKHLTWVLNGRADARDDGFEATGLIASRSKGPADMCRSSP